MLTRMPLTLLIGLLLVSSKIYAQEETGTAAKAGEEQSEVSVTEVLKEASAKARDADLDGAIKLLRETDGDDPRLSLMLLSALQAKVRQLGGGNRDAANEYFHEAGAIARKLAKIKELSPQYRRYLATPIYNEACALAVDGKLDEALESLDQAMQLGFNDFEQIARDRDFAELRKHPKFEPLVTKHHEAMRQQLAAEVQEALEKHQAYDFAFSLPVVGGGEIADTNYKGRVLVADIWGTWCPPCRKEIPHFVRLMDQYGDQGLQVVGINYERGGDEESNRVKISEFMDQYGMNYPCVLGDDETREQVPDFRGFPTTIFIDRHGEVRLTLVGLQSYDKLETVVETLLQE